MPILKKPILYTLMSTLLGFMGWTSGKSTHKTLFEIPEELFHIQNISDRDVRSLIICICLHDCNWGNATNP